MSTNDNKEQSQNLGYNWKGDNDDFEKEFEEDNNILSWILRGHMALLDTKIHVENTLSHEERPNILKIKPRNFKVTYHPPSMDKTIWQKMSKNNKSYDKTLSNISYCFSAVLWPLDNVLCALYKVQLWEEEKDLF